MGKHATTFVGTKVRVLFLLLPQLKIDVLRRRLIVPTTTHGTSDEGTIHNAGNEFGIKG